MIKQITLMDTVFAHRISTLL